LSDALLDDPIEHNSNNLSESSSSSVCNGVVGGGVKLKADCYRLNRNSITVMTGFFIETRPGWVQGDVIHYTAGYLPDFEQEIKTFFEDAMCAYCPEIFFEID
jgi:hypothetical protein